MADYFLYHNVEEGREGKTCLYYGDDEYTYARRGAALEPRRQRAARVRSGDGRPRAAGAAGLPGVRVGVVRREQGRAASSRWSTRCCRAEDYRYYLEYTRARVAVVHESLLDNFARAAQGARYLKNVLVVGRGARHVSLVRGGCRFTAGRAGARRHFARRHRHLALHLRLDRPPEGRRPPAPRPAVQHRVLREARARRKRKRPDRLRAQALLRLRDRHEPPVPVRRRRRDRALLRALDAGEAVRGRRALPPDDPDERADDD